MYTYGLPTVVIEIISCSRSFSCCVRTWMDESLVVMRTGFLLQQSIFNNMKNSYFLKLKLVQIHRIGLYCNPQRHLQENIHWKWAELCGYCELDRLHQKYRRLWPYRHNIFLLTTQLVKVDRFHSGMNPSITEAQVQAPRTGLPLRELHMEGTMKTAQRCMRK